jgi:N-acetyl-gamma-glutamyl-phosphate reductase/acetylglutamate kinase
MLETAIRAFLQESPKLVAALEKLGMRTRPITSGACMANYLDEDKCGLVGRITRIDKRPLEAAVRAGALPIITVARRIADGPDPARERGRRRGRAREGA